MIHKILLILLLSATILAQSAELGIESPAVKSDQEIVAVRDANGRFCAAIQVVCAVKGLKYDAYNGVVRVDSQPGQDMVYLQPDERVLEIFAPGHKPLKLILHDEGIQLAAKEVWQLSLSGEAQNILLTVALLIEPPDAHLVLNGEAAEKGPTHILDSGAHQVRIEHADFRPVDTTISVNPKNAFFDFQLTPLKKADVTTAASKSEPDRTRLIQRRIRGIEAFLGTDEARVFRNGNQLIVRLQADKTFQASKLIFKRERETLVSRVFQVIRQLEPERLTIAVHSDNTRRQRAAKRRTQTQANFIKTSLLREFPNIDASKVRAIGFGGDRPVASNATREGKAKNRRIDLILGKE